MGILRRGLPDHQLPKTSFGIQIDGMSTRTMALGPTEIIDTYAEAFRMHFARIVLTAADAYWLNIAAQTACGYGTSVIGCDAEAGIERWLQPGETPDGRDGVGIMMFGFSSERVGLAMANRVGQCVLTCPTTAVFDGLIGAETQLPLGKYLRYFGDGFQETREVGGRTVWSIPVMEGEFLVEAFAGCLPGVAGGNFLILASDQLVGLTAARAAVAAIEPLHQVITPFPGGVVRAGSKVGSRYKNPKASTAHEYCPTLRDRVTSRLPAGVNCVYEIVVNGADPDAVCRAMAAGIRAACVPGVIAISAGNYGGQLGKYQFRLHELLAEC